MLCSVCNSLDVSLVERSEGRAAIAQSIDFIPFWRTILYAGVIAPYTLALYNIIKTLANALGFVIDISLALLVVFGSLAFVYWVVYTVLHIYTLTLFKKILQCQQCSSAFAASNRSSSLEALEVRIYGIKKFCFIGG